MKKFGSLLRRICLGMTIAVYLSACTLSSSELPVPSQNNQTAAPTQDSDTPVGAAPAQGYIQVVESFYDWYLTGSGGGFSNTPANQWAYRDSPFLTKAMIQKVDMLYARPPEVWNVDPLICAQIGPPELHPINSFANGERPIVVMSIPQPDYYFTVDLILSAKNEWQIDDIHCSFSPEGVVTSFFTWALSQKLDGASLVEKLLSVDTSYFTASYRFELGQKLDAGSSLDTDTLFGKMTEVVSFEHDTCPELGCTRLDIQYTDGTARSVDILWQTDEHNYKYEITGIFLTGQADSAEETVSTPPASPIVQPTLEVKKSPARLAAEQFYTEYLGQYQDGNDPLAEGTYQSSPYIFSGWAYEVGMLAAESPEDPLLCSTEIPDAFTVDAAVIETGAAHVLAHTEPDGPYFTLEMVQDVEWQIMRVICPNSPEGAAWAFYTWYIGYAIGEQALNEYPELLRSAFADDVYRWSPFLSPSVVASAEKTRAQLNADPFLMSQAYPTGYWVSPGEAGDMATVRLQFGPMSAGYIFLHVQEENERWVITEIKRMEVPVFNPETGGDVDISGWKTFTDSVNGFSVRYPTGWVAQEQSLSQGMGWEEIIRSISFMSNETAGAIARQRQNPDPSATPIVPSLQLEVIAAADEDAFNRMHATESIQRFQFNGYKLRVERDYGSVRYVFQLPSRPNFWLVWIDSVSEMPGREDQAVNLEGVLMPLLHSVQISP